MAFWRVIMHTPAIVAIGYDRPEALKRLLSSIEAASYPDGVRPALVISIDKSDSEAVLNTARDFEYSHGEKIVMARQTRMGLREHVLSCGDLTEQYDSIIVLEDDIFVSPFFYQYAVAALDLSDENELIGSISLYDHRFNVHVRESFGAIDDGYDNYYLQIASSWGQAYTRIQWKAFRTWYDANKERDLKGPLVPANISGWSDRSWLKYYIVYLIETKKYTLYPRISLTTNFGDAGTHEKKSDTDLQVPVAGGHHKEYNFSTPLQSHAVYDPFFEAVAAYRDKKVSFGLSGEQDGGKEDDIIMDLYGTKPVSAISEATGSRYVISSQLLPYAVIASFSRQMRPVDANIVYGIAGSDLFMYDLTKEGNRPSKQSGAHRLFYEYRGISAARMVTMIGYRLKEKLFGN